ncbi:MAG: hypothetical protein HRT89_10610 [Lentisphaeria bacterium]|nr:hypothetical protein [Lentisphaeria bacterium]NQZ68507.1 hypothetical protein [Lentisphaeria bacterium]
MRFISLISTIVLLIGCYSKTKPESFHYTDEQVKEFQAKLALADLTLPTDDILKDIGIDKAHLAMSDTICMGQVMISHLQLSPSFYLEIYIKGTHSDGSTIVIKALKIK